MDVLEVYFDEYKQNSKSIKNELMKGDSEQKYKKLSKLLKKNQQCVAFKIKKNRLISWNQKF